LEPSAASQFNDLLLAVKVRIYPMNSGRLKSE
jgi:hypothetical protein